MSKLLKYSAVYGNVATVYHGSKTPPDKMIKIFLSGEFQGGLGAGAMYGEGLYTVYEAGSSSTFRGVYGPYLYKLKINTTGFLILDEEIIDRIYPQIKNKSLSNKILWQVRDMKVENVHVIHEEYGDVYEPIGRQKGVKLHDSPENISRIKDIIYNAQISSDIAIKLFSNYQIDKKFPGVIFSGRTDGQVAVIYDINRAKPLAFTSEKKVKDDIWAKIPIDLLRKNPNVGYDDAVAKVMWKHFPELFLKNIKYMSEYPELGESVIERLSFTDFFDYHKPWSLAPIPTRFGHKYLPVAIQKAKEGAESDPYNFFSYGLHLDKNFEQFRTIAGVNLLKESPDKFFKDLKLFKFDDLLSLGMAFLEKNFERGLLFKEFFDWGLGNYQRTEFNSLRIRAVEGLAKFHPVLFFSKQFSEEYPEFKNIAMKKMVEQSPADFFKLYLHQDNPELGRMAAEALSRKNPVAFFDLGLHKDGPYRYPDLKRKAAEKLVEKSPEFFVGRGLHIAYPEMAKDFAEELSRKRQRDFLSNEMHFLYPELGQKVFESVIAREELHLSINGLGPSMYFQFSGHKTHPNLLPEAIDRVLAIDPGFLWRDFYDEGKEDKDFFDKYLGGLDDEEKFPIISKVLSNSADPYTALERIFSSMKTGNSTISRYIESDEWPPILKMLKENLKNTPLACINFFEHTLYLKPDFHDLKLPMGRKYLEKKPRAYFSHGLYQERELSNFGNKFAKNNADMFISDYMESVSVEDENMYPWLIPQLRQAAKNVVSWGKPHIFFEHVLEDLEATKDLTIWAAIKLYDKSTKQFEKLLEKNPHLEYLREYVIKYDPNMPPEEYPEEGPVVETEIPIGKGIEDIGDYSDLYRQQQLPGMSESEDVDYFERYFGGDLEEDAPDEEYTEDSLEALKERYLDPKFYQIHKDYFEESHYEEAEFDTLYIPLAKSYLSREPYKYFLYEFFKHRDLVEFGYNFIKYDVATFIDRYLQMVGNEEAEDYPWLPEQFRAAVKYAIDSDRPDIYFNNSLEKHPLASDLVVSAAVKLYQMDSEAFNNLINEKPYLQYLEGQVVRYDPNMPPSLYPEDGPATEIEIPWGRRIEDVADYPLLTELSSWLRRRGLIKEAEFVESLGNKNRT